MAKIPTGAEWLKMNPTERALYKFDGDKAKKQVTASYIKAMKKKEDKKRAAKKKKPHKGYLYISRS